MEQIKIIKEPTDDKPFLIIYKPKSLPSAPLTQEDKNNAVSQACDLFPQLKNVTGRKAIEYGLLHRLDTPTDGLLVIASTQECYDYLLQEQNEGRFIKEYTALCDDLPDNAKLLSGFPPVSFENQIITSYFRPYGPGNKEVRPVTEASGKAALQKIGKKKLYSTKVQFLEKDDNKALVKCIISEGYRHQVRCHLAWAGYPIQGDDLYNSDKKNAENLLRFSATKLSFEYPKGDLNSYEITFTWT